MATPREIIVKVKFKCKQTGNIFSYSVEHDIKTMREHPEYEEVKEQTEEPKKAGRPKKDKEEE